MAVNESELCGSCGGEGECECDHCGQVGPCDRCRGTGFDPFVFDTLKYLAARKEFGRGKKWTADLYDGEVRAGRKGSDGAELRIEDFRFGVPSA